MNNYWVKPALFDDSTKIARLWKEFTHEREQSDPSIIVNQNFDFEGYIAQQLSKTLTFCWILEHTENKSSANRDIVGFLLGQYHDESPPPNLSQALLTRHRLNHPYQYRRIGSVLGLYVRPEHRNLEAIKLLVEAALQHAESMKVTDIDLMVGAQLTGLQSLLERLGFTRTAIQYTRHYNLPEGIELPNLHPSLPEIEGFKPPSSGAIPLRDPKTGELVKNPQGNPVFLKPIEEIPEGEGIQLPIYPIPVRNPQNQSFIFDEQGDLVVCPVLRDENNNIFIYKGTPQFQRPAYEHIDSKLQLKKDTEGNYIFCDAKRDATGKILCDQQGKPIPQKILY